MGNNDNLNFLYTNGTVETYDQMLADWYSTATSYMKKVNSVKDFTMAIYFFEMIESVSPNYKNCTKNIEKCKEKITATKQYLHEKELERKEKEEQEKINQQKARKRQKIKKIFKSPAFYILFTIITILVIAMVTALSSVISL